MPENQNDINICRKYLSKFDQFKAKNKNIDISKFSDPIDTEIEITSKLPLYDSSLANIASDILKPLKLSKYI
ncbi:12516_t:CDS:2 [Funneliformis caledonium]|uniref:12516_t:CDS:1 n=1 Tax=Funneliformis caledonium TaxID=1117310 RepID=A0A9N9EEI7_9GLOM|nr:12516_t:CDS:2 [Funneliformis caledonium]